MSVVFSFNGESNINIHGHGQNYDGSILPQKNKVGSKFKNIKSRYLAMMKAQVLGNNSGNPDVTAYVEALRMAKFRDMEAEFEMALVNNYNAFAASLGSGGGFIGGAQGVAAGLSSGNKAQAIAGVESIINAFRTNMNAASLIEAINSNTMSPMEATMAEITGIAGLVKYVSSVMNGSAQYNAKTLSSILTKPSESLAALINDYCEDAGDEAVMETLGKAMTGASSVTANFAVGSRSRGVSGSVQTKSADFRGRDISYSEVIARNGTASVTVAPNLTFTPFATVKTYRSANMSLGLTSYSGANSILVPTLHAIYGSSPGMDYIIYNTLAFSSAGSPGSSMDTNYRIMRSDMIAEMAEKYLIGFSNERAQQMLIFNYRAYPMLTIMSAIADQAASSVEAGNYYGSISSGDIFSISFSAASNDFVGQPGRNNPYLKMRRIERVRKAIEGLTSKGKINMNALTKQVPSLLNDPSNGFDIPVPRFDPGSI